MKGFISVLWIQTVYYSITAIWPLVHIESFMDITGPKTDTWLVKTVGIILLAISISFLYSLFSRKYSPETLVLAMACCCAFILVDCYFVFKGVISKIYLADAVIQVLLLTAWIIVIWLNKVRYKKP